MGGVERFETSGERRLSRFIGGGGAKRLRRDRADYRHGVLHAVLKFVCQKLLLGLRVLELADIADRSDEADSDAEVRLAFRRAPPLDPVVESHGVVFDIVIVRSFELQRVETSALRRLAITCMQAGEKYLEGNGLSRR